jgi:hypothetical protein
VIRILAMVLLVLSSAAADPVRMVREGMALPDQPGPTLVTNVLRLLASTSYQSTSYAVKSNTWETLLTSDSYVHVKLDPAREMMLFAPTDDIRDRWKRERLTISEILVPLPDMEAPRHIYARSGTNFVAHTKYSPFALKRVILEPALKLREHKLYKQYAELPELEPEQKLLSTEPPPGDQ